MTDAQSINETLAEEVAYLREKLAESEELLQAIRSGSVDALVVSGPPGEQVYTLKGADHTYRVLIETMTEGAVILSADGTILYCNGRFAEMVQTPIEKIIGSSIGDFIEAFKKGSTGELLKRSLTEDIRVEMSISRSGDDPLPALVSMRSLSNEGIKSVCMVATDLTQQKQSEQKLKTYADTLHQKNAELIRRAEQLSRLSSELTLSEQRERRRIAEILHDHLQQVLVGAKIGQETLIRSSGKAEWPLAKNILDLLNKSIEISRSLTSELSPHVLRSGDLSASLEWLGKWMYDNHGLEVKVQTEAKIVLERKDLTVLLFQSVRELLFNVVKHSGVKSARVEIDYDEENRFRVCAIDHGSGFDPDTIWEKAKQGTGFGLFSIRERLMLLGGNLKIESSPGEGSTFSLIVPLERTEKDEKPIEQNIIEPHAIKKLGDPIGSC